MCSWLAILTDDYLEHMLFACVHVGKMYKTRFGGQLSAPKLAVVGNCSASENPSYVV